MDEDIPAYKQCLNKLLPYEKEWLIKDFFLSFMYMIGIYSFFLFTHLCFNNFQLAPCINAFTVPIFCLLVTLLCFPILYLPLFKLRSIRTSQLFKWECKIKSLQSTIAEELAALGKDAEEYRKNKILELLSLNFSLISQENEYEEKNIKRLLYVTITYFAEAMHYVEKENSGNSRKGINVLVEDLEKIMKTLKDDYSVKTRGSSGHSGIYSLFSDAKELVIQENGYNSTNFDDYFSSQIQKSMKKEPNNYNLLRLIGPKRRI